MKAKRTAFRCWFFLRACKASTVRLLSNVPYLVSIGCYFPSARKVSARMKAFSWLSLNARVSCPRSGTVGVPSGFSPPVLLGELADEPVQLDERADCTWRRMFSFNFIRYWSWLSEDSVRLQGRDLDLLLSCLSLQKTVENLFCAWLVCLSAWNHHLIQNVVPRERRRSSRRIESPWRCVRCLRLRWVRSW